MEVYNAFPDPVTCRELWNMSENRLIKLKIKMGLIEIPVNQKFHLDPAIFDRIFPETNRGSEFSDYVRISETPPRELTPAELIPKGLLKGGG